MLLITSSALAVYRRCPREYRYRYLDRRRPRKRPEALVLGSAVHAALEAWLRAVQMNTRIRSATGSADVCVDPLVNALSAFDEYIAANVDDEDPELDEYAIAKAQVMVEGYHARWHAKFEALEVVAVEVRFECALRNPSSDRSSRTFRLAGKVDAVVHIDGRLYLVEHKTTSADLAPSSDYWTRLRMDGQVSVYTAGVRASGYRVEGCLYDVLRKPGTRPLLTTPKENRRYTKGKSCKICRKAARDAGQWPKTTPPTPPPKPTHDCAECDQPRLHKDQRLEDESVDAYRSRLRHAVAAAPESYYGQGMVVRTDDEMAEHDMDTWLQARALRDSSRFDGWPKNPDGCVRFNRRCAYWGVCTHTASLDGDEFESTDAHPELSNG
jgi:hypothetical protein